jgi:hypothetical protein
VFGLLDPTRYFLDRVFEVLDPNSELFGVTDGTIDAPAGLLERTFETVDAIPPLLFGVDRLLGSPVGILGAIFGLLAWFFEALGSL